MNKKERKDTRKKFGFKGEDIACEYLEKQGYRLIERNFRTRTGEIDLIMSQGPFLIFVEVKTRRSSLYGDGRESITRQKQTRIKTTALHYLQNHTHTASFLRFDVILITFQEKKLSQISHLPNAF